MKKEQVVIPKSWLSELPALASLVILGALSVYLSNTNEWSIITGDIITIGSKKITLTLPLFWCMPLTAGLTAIYRVYNVRYAMDSRGIEAKVGILGPWQTVTRIRFEDIRSVEYSQSILGRIFDIGMVEIGTAATSAIEVTFRGVSAPSEIQQQIQRERNARIKLASEQGVSLHEGQPFQSSPAEGAP